MDYKYIISLLLVLGVFVGILFIPNNTHSTNLNSKDYFRMHIRANSNSEVDQNIKYVIRDGVVEALTPLLSNVESKSEAMQLLQNNLDIVVDTANQILLQNGFC